jgi:hypothetical protein
VLRASTTQDALQLAEHAAAAAERYTASMAAMQELASAEYPPEAVPPQLRAAEEQLQQRLQVCVCVCVCDVCVCVCVCVRARVHWLVATCSPAPRLAPPRRCACAAAPAASQAAESALHAALSGHIHTCLGQCGWPPPLVRMQADGAAFDPSQLFSPAHADAINTLQHLMKALTRLQLAAQHDAIAAALQVRVHPGADRGAPARCAGVDGTRRAMHAADAACCCSRCLCAGGRPGRQQRRRRASRAGRRSRQQQRQQRQLARPPHSVDGAGARGAAAAAAGRGLWPQPRGQPR